MGEGKIDGSVVSSTPRPRRRAAAPGREDSRGAAMLFTIE